jgi:hypothetical protein
MPASNDARQQNLLFLAQRRLLLDEAGVRIHQRLLLSHESDAGEEKAVK